MWLRVEIENRALYLDELGNSNFHEAHLPFGTVLGVEGPSSGLSPRVSISSTAQSSSAGSSSSFNSAPHPPAFKSVIPKSKETKCHVDEVDCGHGQLGLDQMN